jgi:hypothetical protein
MEIIEVITKAMRMLLEIIEQAQNGVSKEEIFERQKKPGSVGSDLIDSVQKRQKDGEEFLGRD